MGVDTSSRQMGSGVFARREAGPAPSGLRPLGEIWSSPQEVSDFPPDLTVVLEVPTVSRPSSPCELFLSRCFHLGRRASYMTLRRPFSQNCVLLWPVCQFVLLEGQNYVQFSAVRFFGQIWRRELKVFDGNKPKDTFEALKRILLMLCVL